MEIDCRHLKIPRHPEKSLLSLDQVLLEIKNLSGEAPDVIKLQKHARSIDQETREISKAVLNILVPNLAELEKQYGSNPKGLQDKVEAEISKSMTKLLSKEELGNIGRAFGIDPDIYPTPEKFLEFLSKRVYETLGSKANLTDAVTLLTSGKFLELISKSEPGFFQKFKKLLSEIAEALNEYASALDFRPAPFRYPEPTAPRPKTEVYLPPEILALFVRKEEVVDALWQEKKPSFFDAIAEACEDLGLAREHEHHKHKLEESQEDESEENKRKKIEDFIAHNSELSDALKALLDDQHFTDAPLTQYARLLALERAEKLKQV